MIGVKVGGNVKKFEFIGNEFIDCDTGIEIKGDMEETVIEGNKFYNEIHDEMIEEILEKLRKEFKNSQGKVENNKADKLVDIMSNIASNVISEVMLKFTGLK